MLDLDPRRRSSSAARPLTVVAGATHLFEEPGTLRLAAEDGAGVVPRAPPDRAAGRRRTPAG